MKKNRCIIILCLFGLFFWSSCQKDYLVGGGVHDPNVNMTTYDFLKSNKYGQFDTLIKIIDFAGMKNVINGNVTFFAPPDYCIINFLNIRRAELRKENEKNNFTLDSLFTYFTPQQLADSLSMYIFPGKITRETLSTKGKFYTSISSGLTMNIGLQQSSNVLVDGLLTTKPEYVYLKKVLGELDDTDGNDPSGDNKNFQDVTDICQTSGILTTNGVLHVLKNQHAFMFYKFHD